MVTVFPSFAPAEIKNLQQHQFNQMPSININIPNLVSKCSIGQLDNDKVDSRKVFNSQKTF